MTVKHAEFQTSGVMLAASVTVNFQTLLSMLDDADILVVANSLDQPVVITIPNETGAPGQMTVPGFCSFSIDLMTNNKRVAKGTVQIKALSSLPTSGLISVTAIK